MPLCIFLSRTQLILTFLSQSPSRSPWEGEQLNLDLQSLVSQGSINEEGYVNVASQLGLSTIRGMYTYAHIPFSIPSSYSTNLFLINVREQITLRILHGFNIGDGGRQGGYDPIVMYMYLDTHK